MQLPRAARNRTLLLAIPMLMLLPLILSLGAAPVRAAPPDEEAWLDDPAITWNQPGDDILSPPEGMGTPAFCQDLVREPETDADRQIVAAGWKLVFGYESGWGTTIVRAAGGFDGNCRPSPFTAFFFVDGRYAGRSAPIPAWPRTDGALASATVASGGAVIARYDRHGPNGPMCCPDGATIIIFAVDQTPDGPVMRPNPGRTLVAPDGRMIRQITPAPGSAS